jgi:hypothetical protein
LCSAVLLGLVRYALIPLVENVTNGFEHNP